MWVQCGDMKSSQIRLVKDGNSWAVRIPKQALVASGFDKTNGLLDLDVKQGKIVLTPSQHPRLGWPRQIIDDIEKNGQVRRAWL